MTAIASRFKGNAAVARASAILTSSYVAGTTIDVQNAASLGLLCTYTQGGASGAATLKLLVSDDNVTFYPLLVPNSSVSSGGVTEFRALIALPVSAGATAEVYALPPIDVSAWGWVQVAAAETGNTSPCGTLAITATAASGRR